MTTFADRSAPLFVVLALSAAALIGTIFFGRPTDPPTASLRAAKGHSAVGYGALVSWIEKEEGLAVRISRSHTMKKIGPDDLVLALEPRVEGPESRVWKGDLLREVWLSSRLILVLPKWRALPDPSHSGWAESVHWVARSEAEAVLQLAFETVGAGKLVDGAGADSVGTWQWNTPSEGYNFDFDENDDSLSDARHSGEDRALPTDGADDGAEPPPAIVRRKGSAPRDADTERVATIASLQTMSAPSWVWTPIVENEDGVLAAFIAQDFLVISDPTCSTTPGSARVRTPRWSRTCSDRWSSPKRSGSTSRFMQAPTRRASGASSSDFP
ncbi:MAG: hypothetical protein R3E12_11365 [Candidatus Eisenbacteria bacterium]